MPLKYYIYTLSLKPMGLGGFERLFGEEKFMLGHKPPACKIYRQAACGTKFKNIIEIA